MIESSSQTIYSDPLRMTENELKYWAFLGVSQPDNCERRPDSETVSHRCWGDWLHAALQSFSIPTEFVGQPNGRGEIIPERIEPIFQATPAPDDAAELSAEVRQALERSICLVVVCSPRSANSLRVNEMVRYFKQLGRGQNILPIVIAGEPYASDGQAGRAAADECFVPALRHPVLPDGTLDLTRRANRQVFVDARHGADKREILANDHRQAEADLEMAKVQLIALVVSVGFNNLWQREQRRHFFDFAEAQAQIREAQRQVREAQSKVLEIQNLPPDVQQQIQEAQAQVLTAQNQAREAQHQLREFQDKFRDAQAQLDEARQRSLASESKFLEAQNLAQAAQNQLEEFRHQPPAAPDQPGELAELREQVEAAQAKLADAESQLAEAHERAIADEEKVRAAENLLREAQDQILELQQRSPDVDSQVTAAQNEAREAQEQLWELQDKIQEAQIQLQEAQQQALADERKILAAENLAQATQEQLEALQNRETTDVSDQLAELRQQAEDAQNKCSAAENQLAEAREQVRAAQAQVLEAQQSAQNQILAVQNVAPDLHAQIQAAQQQAAEAQNQARVAQEQLQEFQNKVQAAQTQLAEARQQALADEGKVLAALESAREAQNQLAAAQNQVRELQSAQGQLTETHQQAQADAAKKLVTAQNEVREFQNQVHGAQNQLEETRQQVRVAQSRAEAAQQQAQLAQEQVRELQNKISDTQAQLEAARARSLADENKILAAQTLAEETQRQLAQARNQVQAAHEQIQALANRTRDAQSQIEAAQNQVGKLSDKNRNTRRLTQVFAVLAVLGLVNAGVDWQKRQRANAALAKANSTPAAQFDPATVGADQERIQQALQNLGGAGQAQSLDELAAWIPRPEIPEALKASTALLNDQQRSHFQKWLLIRLGWVNPLAAMTNASAIDGKIVNDAGANDSNIYLQLAVLDNWMKTDLAGAFQWVCQLTDAAARQRAVEKIVPALVANDPIQAIQQRQQLSNHDEDNAMLCAVLKVWLAQQPAAAVNWVKAEPDSKSKNVALITCIDDLAKTDIPRALALAESLPTGIWRNVVMADLFNRWFAKDPEMATAFAIRHPELADGFSGAVPGAWFPLDVQ